MMEWVKKGDPDTRFTNQYPLKSEYIAAQILLATFRSDYEYKIE